MTAIHCAAGVPATTEAFQYNLSNLTVTRAEATGDVITGFRLGNTGQAESGDDNSNIITWGDTIAAEWQLPLDGTQAALYEAQAVEVSKSDPGANATFTGTMSSWLDLGTTRFWTLLQPEDVTVMAEWIFDITIRDIAGQNTAASARITLQSQVN